MAETARWILLVIGLPGGATSRARVATWRKLKRSGALALKDSVYLLPATDDATETANWLAGEIRAVGGDASIARVTSISGLDDAAIVEQLNALRDSDYAEIEADIAPFLKRAAKGDEDARARLRSALRRAAHRLDELSRIDFFKSAKGPRVRELCEQARRVLEDAGATGALPEPREVLDRTPYQGRVWATRARPKIDRLASAWLIRHFIDPAARFAFVGEGEKPGKGTLTFDTFGGDFTHEGDDCTFEVLVRRFGLEDPGLRALADVVHDADLGDDKFGRQEHVGLNAIVSGLVANIRDDQALVIAAFPVFAALETAFAADARRPSREKRPARRASRAPRRRNKKVG
ncbi:chromate resistance protein [bacterium]|nr:chromate resistance protein [bacterium]